MSDKLPSDEEDPVWGDSAHPRHPRGERSMLCLPCLLEHSRVANYIAQVRAEASQEKDAEIEHCNELLRNAEALFQEELAACKTAEAERDRALRERDEAAEETARVDEIMAKAMRDMRLRAEAAEVERDEANLRRQETIAMCDALREENARLQERNKRQAKVIENCPRCMYEILGPELEEDEPK